MELTSVSNNKLCGQNDLTPTTQAARGNYRLFRDFFQYIGDHNVSNVEGELKAYLQASKTIFTPLVSFVARTVFLGMPYCGISAFLGATMRMNLPHCLPSFMDATKARSKPHFYTELREDSEKILNQMGSSIETPEIYVGDTESAQGFPLLSGKHYIQVGRHDFGLDEHDDFILRHEVAHGVNHDALIMDGITAIGMIFIEALYSDTSNDIESVSFSDVLIRGLLIQFFTLVVLVTCGRLMEARADRLAVETDPDPTKMADKGIKALEKALESNIESRAVGSRQEKLIARIRYTPEGDDRFDLSHPPIRSRISQITDLKSKYAHPIHE